MTEKISVPNRIENGHGNEVEGYSQSREWQTL